MAIRVVARIRPQQESELGKDVIVSTGSNNDASSRPNLVKIPNPKNEAETFSFQFNSVYGFEASQQDVFYHESQSPSSWDLASELIRRSFSNH